MISLNRAFFYLSLAVVLVLLLFHSTAPFASLDISVLKVAQMHPTLSKDDVAVLMAVIGAPFMSLLLIGICSLVLLKRRQLRALVLFLALFALGTGFEYVSKLQVEHPRPTREYVRKLPSQAWYRMLPDVSVPGDNSFPSGHCFRAVYLMGVCVVLFWPRRSTAKYAMILALFAYVALAGWSRLYLGAHWPSDVLGGFALGAIGWLIFQSFTLLPASAKEDRARNYGREK